MKLLSVHSAKSIWLVPINFLNPRGIFLRPAIVALKERYDFAVTPLEKPPVTEKNGWIFERGAFKNADGVIIAVNMTIHDDGIVIETRSSTEDGDLFLEDMLTWISKESKLPSYNTLPIKKIYTSELYVKFKKMPQILDKRLASFLKQANEAIGHEKGPLDLSGFGLSTDLAQSERPLTFRFERQVNTPFSENQYYSFIPAKTELHIKLLEKLEEVS